MTNLPATMVEAEALMFAREWIAHAKTHDYYNLGLASLHPDAGRALLRRRMKQHALQGAPHMLMIVDYALAGWDDADIVCRELILEFTNWGEPLPAFLATYNAKVLTGDGQRPRGKKKATNYLQDIVIVALIVELIERFHLHPTRHQISKKKKKEKKDRRGSACSIATAAMTEAGLHRGEERAVQEIWRRLEPIAAYPGCRWRTVPK